MGVLKSVKYKKLNDKELENLYHILHSKYATDNMKDAVYERYAVFVKKYYPNTAVKAIFGVNAEYNDSTYDCNMGYVVVFDGNDNEISPIKGKELEARKEVFNLPMPNNSYYNCYDNPNETFIVYVGKYNIPDIYVEEIVL